MSSERERARSHRQPERMRIAARRGTQAMKRRARNVIAGRRLGGLEAEIMQFIWSQDRPVGVNDIVPALKGRKRAYTTVMTIVTRLCEKGLITRERQGRAFVYRPVASKEETAAEALRDLLASTEDPQAVLARFVKDLEASPQLLRRLRKLARGGREK